MKFLFCASTQSHIRNFHLPYIKALKERGHEVYVAANADDGIPYVEQSFAFSFTKSLFSFRNITAIFKIRRFLLSHRFDKVSTHTALSSVIVRCAILLIPRNLRPKVYYIAHGFLFHENDGLKKWLYLLPEKICAPVTNVLMVINREDSIIAQKHRLYRDGLVHINGIGIDLSRFHPLPQGEREEKRKQLGFSKTDVLFIYAAEFSKRKNQAMLIRAFAKAARQMPNAHLLLAGDGILFEQCKELAKSLDVQRRVHFLGYVQDMAALYPICDAAVSASRIEGLPFNVMEAMSCGLPVLLSDIKGHRDLTDINKEFLFRTEQELEEKLIKLAAHPAAAVDWSMTLEKYKLHNVMESILSVYEANP